MLKSVVRSIAGNQRPTAHANTTMTEGVRRSIAATPTVITNANLRVKIKPISLPSRPASRPTGALAGPFASLPTNSSPSKRSTRGRSPTKPFARYKKPAASPIQAMGDPARTGYRVHLPHGRCPFALPRTIRPRTACRLFRRAPQTADQAG